ncbi:zeta-sarcoglycan [Crotalus adamanteus]|uniref:Zeta-sarcoglycan n=1 Tax=Crotalus adamanteus TaxID=8729 RepID=A0AAW1BAD5_CROAD
MKGAEGVEAQCKRFEVSSSEDGRVLFSADEEEIVIGADRLKVTGTEGAVFEHSVETPHIRAEPSQDLKMGWGWALYCEMLQCTKKRLYAMWLGWAGLGWAGLGWAGLGWAGLGWAGLGWKPGQDSVLGCTSVVSCSPKLQYTKKP